MSITSHCRSGAPSYDQEPAPRPAPHRYRRQARLHRESQLHGDCHAPRAQPRPQQQQTVPGRAPRDHLRTRRRLRTHGGLQVGLIIVQNILSKYIPAARQRSRATPRPRRSRPSGSASPTWWTANQTSRALRRTGRRLD